MIFLASPYSSRVEHVRHMRAMDARCALGTFTREGYVVFSPIATSHDMTERGVRKWNDPWWYEWSIDFLSKADELWVLMLDGWRESKGVLVEITTAQANGIPVRYVDPKTLEVREKP